MSFYIMLTTQFNGVQQFNGVHPINQIGEDAPSPKNAESRSPSPLKTKSNKEAKKKKRIRTKNNKEGMKTKREKGGGDGKDSALGSTSIRREPSQR